MFASLLIVLFKRKISYYIKGKSEITLWSKHPTQCS